MGGRTVVGYICNRHLILNMSEKELCFSTCRNTHKLPPNSPITENDTIDRTSALPLILTSRLGFFSFSHPLRSLNRIHWQVLLPLLQMASLAAQTAKTLPSMQALSLGREDALEKGMATHSSILAWEIPWAEEPGGLQSVAFSKELDMTERLTLRYYCKCSSKSGHTVAHSRPTSQSKPL